MSNPPSLPEAPRRRVRKQHPFRRAVLGGLALILPPLLTIVVFIWAWTIIDNNVLARLETGAQHVIVWAIKDVHTTIPESVAPGDVVVRRDSQTLTLEQLLDGRMPDSRLIHERVAAAGASVVGFRHRGRFYVPLGNNEWIPQGVYETVRQNPGGLWLTTASGHDYYLRYAKVTYLRRSLVIPIFLVLFISILYLLGRFVAAGVGRMLWSYGEGVIHRVPVIRNVYSSMKQVTDFLFSEREIEFHRVVAVQYPRKGVWSIGFVTGESLVDIRSAANEPVLTVLIPTSPMPATGFTITVLRSETVDLDISLDQAIQFIVSCGVVVPLQQQYNEQSLSGKLTSAIAAQPSANGSPTAAAPRAQAEERP